MQSCSCSSAIPVSLKFEIHETDLPEHSTFSRTLSGGLDGSSAVFTRGPWLEHRRLAGSMYLSSMVLLV